MRRSHFSVAVLCAILCVCIVLRMERHRLRHWRAAAHASTPAASATPVRSADGMKTNAPTAGASDGLFLGKDKLVYINYGTRDPALQLFMKAVMNGSYDTTAKGRAIFLKVCAACHQPDGMGKEGVGPPLTGSEWVLAPQGDRLVRIVLNGMTGPMQVKGHEWNLAMPPWRESLKDDEIAVVLTYVRTKVGGNNAGPITPESVAAARNEVHPGPETVAELLKPEE